MSNLPLSNIEVLNFLVFLNSKIIHQYEPEFKVFEKDFNAWNKSSNTSSIYFKYLAENDILEYKFLDAEYYKNSIETPPAYKESDFATDTVPDIIIKKCREDSINTSGKINIDKFNSFFETKVGEVQTEIISLENDKKDILGFNPKNMNSNIIKTKKDIEKFINDKKDSKVYQVFEDDITELSKCIKSIETVNDNYEEVYKNIIKPVRAESDKGLKTTKNTAMISIIITVIFSLVIQIGALYISYYYLR